MRDGLFEYGDAVIVTATDEKGIVNINQVSEDDAIEVKLNSGEINQYHQDDLEFDLDFRPDTGE
ncbi:hypothetical protein [Mucilaginibacter ginkgonis]|uniref:Uncharacterized protein n=1 Tax=Mucilaginibacter ginkgonis TaxID=2682091 RepID=A0A6I4I5G9_9SPHI|nr:hypothetical protein [Mucilaginibacter ginkgonis]QQL48425.1 hypothetical protein GO620_009485 [Mucilaginibacter ginkgonis]